jgi:hypothetical protein
MSAVATKRRVTGGGVALVIVGSLLGLLALGVLGGGGAVLWADQTQRDSNGYFSSAAHTYASSTYAITHEGAHVDGLPNGIEDELARIRVTATSANGRPVFVGIARERDVKAYLSNVSYSKLTNLDVDPFRPEYAAVSGNAQPAAPAAQNIWAASATGSGTQDLSWRVRNGTWAVVLMNADGSRGVAADVGFGANVRFLGWISAGLFAVGAILLTGAVLLIVFGARRRQPGRDEPTGQPAVATG